MNYQKIINELTPVEEHAGVLYKRDDLFRPFKDSPLNGGKVRQALALVSNNYDVIKEKHGGVLATASSVHSPQGIIVSRIAKMFGFKSILGISNTNKNIDEVCNKHYNLKKVRELGGDIHVVTSAGYSTVISAKLKEKFPNAFHISFGMNFKTDKSSIIECISNQVQNIPDGLDNLIITVGSAITTCGILNGLYDYKKKIKNIYLVQIAGYDRTDIIKDILRESYFDKFMIFNKKENRINTTIESNIFNIASKEYPYVKLVKVDISNSLSLDMRYESKAYDYTFKYIRPTGKTLFWIIGNANWLYK